MGSYIDHPPKENNDDSNIEKFFDILIEENIEDINKEFLEDDITYPSKEIKDGLNIHPPKEESFEDSKEEFLEDSKEESFEDDIVMLSIDNNNMDIEKKKGIVVPNKNININIKEEEIMTKYFVGDNESSIKFLEKAILCSKPDKNHNIFSYPHKQLCYLWNIHNSCLKNKDLLCLNLINLFLRDCSETDYDNFKTFKYYLRFFIHDIKEDLKQGLKQGSEQVSIYGIIWNNADIKSIEINNNNKYICEIQNYGSTFYNFLPYEFNNKQILSILKIK